MCTPTTKTDNKQVTKSANRSKRCVTNDNNADDTVWIERKVNFAGGQRSYFQSFKTGSCVWDEPPAGVSRIVKAHDLKKYPQLALYISTQVALPTTSKPRGWFSMFRRNEGKARS
ncbi:hypothetical protein MHU86_12837 [Fragilaria crotonensis]|nr:hypothetical protein MHU86_12837 [Fragilaria crotonensis]